MQKKIKRLSIVLTLAVSMWACNGSNWRSPTEPPLTPPPLTPPAAYTLSGVVSEVTPTGLAPVEGVAVLEFYSRAQVKSDANGFYGHSGLRAGGLAYLVFSKEGYQNVESDRIFTITGDTRYDAQLIRR